MEVKTKIILNDFLSKTYLKDQDNPFITQEDLKTNMDRYLLLYTEFEGELATFSAYFHYRINTLFEFWNTKFKPTTGGYFNADPSRELILLIDSYRDISENLKNSEDEITILDNYLETMDSILPLLSSSGGSIIPIDFGRIRCIKKYDPIFILTKTNTSQISSNTSYKLNLIGEGSYAIVKKYFDQHYQRWFAIKQAKSDLTEKEIQRFKKEYDILSKIKFPYILEVFSYNSKNNSYTMEFCDFSLKDYIIWNNQKLSFAIRKRMALQFLYGVDFLYKKKLFHRDLSWNNILVKLYDQNIIYIKISDFGLVKEEDSELTDSDTSGKGSTFHKDPLLESFKDVRIENEIYSVGCLLSFIFTGKQNLNKNQLVVGLDSIIEKCTDNKSLENRYHSITEIIDDINKKIIT
jgi:tRNA A-37 threonylcarbamoyl transferase component Bud32